MCGGEVQIGFWWGNLKERDHFEDPIVDGRWIFRKLDVVVWIGSSWLRIGTGGGTCECNNKPSGSIQCGEFLD
jgi:hypothetical protein